APTAARSKQARREERPAWLFELLEQPEGCRSARLGKIGERLETARGVSRNGAQQFRKLVSGTRVEPAIGAARQADDFAECPLGHRVVPLLKQEYRNAPQSEFPRRRRERIDRL